MDEIRELEAQLTGDMFTDMDIKEKIHELKMKINNVTSQSCEVGCDNCSG